MQNFAPLEKGFFCTVAKCEVATKKKKRENCCSSSRCRYKICGELVFRYLGKRIFGNLQTCCKKRKNAVKSEKNFETGAKNKPDRNKGF